MDLLLLREDYDETTAPKVTGRTLTLKLATIGRVYTVGRKNGTLLRERIMPGALKGPLARPSGVLRYRHVGERPGDTDSLDSIYGVMTRMWVDDDDQVLSDWEVFPGPDGDKILRVAPAVRGASISAIVRDSRPAKDAHGTITDLVRISQVNGASLTPTPAYDDAGVLAVRERTPKADPEAARRHAKTIADTRAALAKARKLVG